MLPPSPDATPEEAVQAIAKQMGRQAAEKPRRTTTNGFSALVFVAGQVRQDPQSGQQTAGVRVLCPVIQDGKSCVTSWMY